MKSTLLLTAAVSLAACGPETSGKPGPPADQLYFPSGLVFARAPGASEGFVYVASSNFDKRYAHGAVTALDLSRAGLPAFGAEVPATGPMQIPTLPIAERGVVSIESFAGEMAALTRADGSLRLFVPSRAEDQRLHAIDAVGGTLTCAGGGSDCIASSPSLTANVRSSTGIPRAPGPYGVAVAPEGEVFVTELDAVDSPTGSARNWTAYLVKVDAEDVAVADESFIELGHPGNSVVAGSRYAFVSGRFSGRFDYRLLTLVDRQTGALVQPALEQTFKVLDARGLALSSDERRLYIAARFPDTLLVVDVAGAATAAPVLTVVGAVPLPEGPNAVSILPRPGRGDLVAITCSSSGIVALYDADLGDLVAQVTSVGNQPFGIAADPIAAGARLYVSNFADGRVAVIDVADFDRPYLSRVVAHLGAGQTCVTTPKACQEVAQ